MFRLSAKVGKGNARRHPIYPPIWAPVWMICIFAGMKAEFTMPVVFASALMMLLTSCADEDFQDPNADPREKFLGAWVCKETIGSAAPQTFTIYFTSYGTSDTVRISNFSGYGNTAVAYALVSGNSLQIPQQQMPMQNRMMQEQMQQQQAQQQLAQLGVSAAAIALRTTPAAVASII